MFIFKCNFHLKKNIDNLPLYHSPYFYAFLKNFIKDDTFYKNIAIVPFTMGMTNLLKNEEFFCLIFCYNSSSKNLLQQILNDFNNIFQDTNSKISLDSIELKSYELLCLEDILEKELNSNLDFKSLTLSFFTPLRKKRPIRKRKKTHSFFDLEYFYSNKECLYELFTPDRFDKSPPEEIKEIYISEVEGFWIDVPYSHNKTIGGFCGDIVITGNFSENLIKFLIKNQYYGIGKNKAFGFGFYSIVESKNIFNQILETKNHYYQRLKTRDLILSAILSLKNTAPGIDKVELQDVLEAKEEVVNYIRNQLNKNNYNFMQLKSVSIKKSDDDYRILKIPSMYDKIVEKSMMLAIEEAIEKQLSISVYSYRRKSGVKKAVNTVRASLKKGYFKAIKADIKKYFDNIDKNKLLKQIKIFLRDVKFSEFLEKWLSNLNKEGVSGIAQGSPLSPILSNIYLDYFDKEIVKHKLILTRFGDDFLVMFKEGDFKDVLLVIENILKSLYLKLNYDKITFYDKDESIEFLGYTIHKNKITKIPKASLKHEKGDKIFSEKFLDPTSARIVYNNL